MTAASDKELSVLHSKVAAVLLKKLDSADQATYLLSKYEVRISEDEEGDEDLTIPEEVYNFLVKQMDASPALLTVITKFLKDNDITAVVDESKELTDLDRRLQSKQYRRVVGNVLPLKDEDE